MSVLGVSSVNIDCGVFLSGMIGNNLLRIAFDEPLPRCVCKHREIVLHSAHMESRSNVSNKFI